MIAAAQVADIDSSDAQCTPKDLAWDLGCFWLDPCGSPRSHIRAMTKYQLEDGQDGLSLPWACPTGLGPCSVFVNGPYSNPLPWCERLAAHDGPWCSLWKLDPSTRWFHCLMASGATWAPFKSRLKYERPGNCGVANFASVLVWKHWTPPTAVLARLWGGRKEK